MYLDGKQVSEANWDSTYEVRGIWLGSRQVSNVRYQWRTEHDFVGKIDTVMAFSSCLDSDTIRVLAKCLSSCLFYSFSTS
jgi:hypothetical protein